MTDDQVIKVFAVLFDMEIRKADLAVLKVLDPNGITAAGLAEYLWDHWMGEPAKPTVEQVEAVINEALHCARRRPRSLPKPMSSNI
jgi:hypothetical protein